MARQKKIPDKADWEGYEEDLDVRYFHTLAYGKTIEEVQLFFGEGRSIERMSELLFTPRRVFQYYVFSFAAYVMSGQAEGDPDSASPFLSLLEEREKRDPGSVSQIFLELEEVIDFVAAGQEYFDADPNIYGSFEERANRIRKACNA